MSTTKRRGKPRLYGMALLLAFVAAAVSLLAQDPSQQVPDAPSAVQPPPKPAPPPPPSQQQQAPANPSAPPPQSAADQPSIRPRQTAGSQATQNGRDEMAYKISTTVNYVVVPVLVKNLDGGLVQG